MLGHHDRGLITSRCGFESRNAHQTKLYFGVYHGVDFNYDRFYNCHWIRNDVAGYKDKDIAPLFKGCGENCNFPEQWEVYLKE